MKLSQKSREWVIRAARSSIEHFLDTKAVLVHDIERIPETVREELSERYGVFAIIKTKDKKTGDYSIRGMMGTIHPSEEMWKVMPAFAVNAAFFDHRTPRLKPYELNEISIHFVVVNALEELSLKNEELTNVLEEEKSGIVMEYNNRESYFLPYIWNDYPEASQVLRVLALQMGLKATMATSGEVKYHLMRTQEISEF